MRLSLALAALMLATPALADPVRIVAGENFWGDVAAQIGGDHVAVTSILSNPDQDPHLFEASAETARSLANAQIAIVSGADYDPWMEKLIAAHKAPSRKVVTVAALVGRKAGDNPHLWYDPAYVKAAAHAIALDLESADAAHKADYQKGETAFVASLQPLDAKIVDLKKRFAGADVTASEPVFGYQAALIGLKVHNEKFALAVMNNTEPSASDVAAFENDLKGKKVRVMFYNAQASEPAVQKLVDLAKANGIPVVGVSETEPPQATYQSWMLAQLDALDAALSGKTQ